MFSQSFNSSNMSPSNKSVATSPSVNSQKNLDSMPPDSLIEECNRLIEHFKNPYLKALFNYILNKDDAISMILVSFFSKQIKSQVFYWINVIFFKHDQNLLLQDRIALSICFMYNSKNQVIHFQLIFQYLIFLNISI